MLKEEIVFVWLELVQKARHLYNSAHTWSGQEEEIGAIMCCTYAYTRCTNVLARSPGLNARLGAQIAL